MTRNKRVLKIFLTDGRVLFRRGLKALISAESDLEVVGEAETLAEGLAMARLLSPDALVVDLALINDSGHNDLATRQIAASTGILFLVDEDRPDVLEKAVTAGARGYMLKNSSPAHLIAGVRQVALPEEQNPNGVSMITPDLKALAASSSQSRGSVLTLREVEVMRLLAEGRTVREVATDLALSIKTIEAHKLNLMRKLDIHNRTSLIECAARMGLLVPQPEAVSAR